MSKSRKVLSILLCALVALVMGIGVFTTSYAETDESVEQTVATEAKAEVKAEVKSEPVKAAVKEESKSDVKSEDKEEQKNEKTEEVKTEARAENTEETKEQTEEDSQTTGETVKDTAEDKKETEETTTESGKQTKIEQKKEPASKEVTDKVAQKKAEAKAKEEEVGKANPAVEEAAEGDTTKWDYAPGWAGSDQKYIRGNLLAAATARELSIGVKAYVEEVKESVKAEGEVQVNEDADNIADALAVYAVLTEQTDCFPYGIEVGSEDEAKLLQSTYWNMTQITGVSNKDGNVFTVKRLSIDESAELLGLTEEQKEAAKQLLNADSRADVELIIRGSILATLTDEELKAIEERLPAELSPERKAVLMAGLSLEGKIGYFWGGKSYHTGWDERWGEMRTVVGSKQDGKVKPLGLDCSGFVSWAFINAAGDQSALSYIGNGTANQYQNSKPIEWNEVQPGDLLFYKNPSAGGVNHVGIVLTVSESGTPKEVIHCASSKNGVVVTGPMGFKYARRPYIYGE